VRGGRGTRARRAPAPRSAFRRRPPRGGRGGHDMTPTETTERLVSSDSHVMFTDEWVKARLATRLHPVWDAAVARQREHQKRVNQGGQPDLDMEDFVDLEAAQDPGHFEPHAKLKAMDRDGVYAEVIFPEVGGAKYCTPPLMGEDWRECLR